MAWSPGEPHARRALDGGRMVVSVSGRLAVGCRGDPSALLGQLHEHPSMIGEQPSREPLDVHGVGDMGADAAMVSAHALVEDGDVLVGHDRAEVGQRALVHPAARVVLEELADGAVAEGLLDLGGTGAGDGGELGVPADRGVQGGHDGLHLLDADEERVARLAPVVHDDVDGGPAGGEVGGTPLGEVAPVGARDQLERALHITETALGPDHPQTRQIRRNLDAVK